MGITTGLFGERMHDQFAPLEAGLSHFLDQLEVLTRLLFGPGRAPGREPHHLERRVIERMANDAPCVTITFGQEDRLYLGLEELVIELWRCGRRSRLAPRLRRGPGCRQGQTGHDERTRRRPLHYGTSQEIM